MDFDGAEEQACSINYVIAGLAQDVPSGNVIKKDMPDPTDPCRFISGKTLQQGGQRVGFFGP
jgi:hypothetical protein